jgi:hypothetical protein
MGFTTPGRLFIAALGFVLFSASGALAGPAGTYIKDERELDELGPKAAIEITEKWGEGTKAEIVVGNPALCGGAVGGPIQIKNGQAALEDGECRLQLAFLPNRVMVTEKSAPCFTEKCRLQGAFFRYGAPPKPIPDMIQRTRARFQHINANLADMDPVEKDLEGFSTEGGSLKTWEYMGHPKKIAIEIFGEMGKTLEEYYFFDGDLIFAFQQAAEYESPHDAKVKTVREDRFYFHQGTLLKWVDADKKEVPPGGPLGMEKAKEVLNEAAKFGRAAESDKNPLGPIDVK